MNKKVTLIIIIVLFAIVLGLIIYPVAMNSKVEQLTREYITDVGYDNEDIKEIKIGHSYINKLLGYNEWRISVEFNKLSNKFDENIKASFWFSYREDKIFFEGTNLEPISEDKGLVIKYMDSFKDGTLLDNENFPIEERIDPEDETKKELCIETVFRGIVKRIEEESIILEPEGNEVKFICAIPIKNMPASPEPVVGDIVEVVYDGSIEDTHPAKLGNLGNIQTVRVIREEISGDSLAPVEE